MKLEIELDLNKIDYDSINKQIAEKVAALDIKEMYDVELRINNRITDLIEDNINMSYNRYIKKSFWDDGTTDDGKKLIEGMIKAEIENRTNQVIEKIFADDYNEDTMREVMLKMIPDIFSYALFARIDKALSYKESNYYADVFSMVRSEIDSKINRMRY